jgi:hypothetical protein
MDVRIDFTLARVVSLQPYKTSCGLFGTTLSPRKRSHSWPAAREKIMVNEILVYFPIPIYKLFHLLSAFHTRLIPRSLRASFDF